MALLTYARDVNGKMPLFAVVADDEGADYLFPEEVEPWLDEARLDDLVDALDVHPTDEEGWLELATANLGLVVIDAPTKYGDVDTAITEADKELTKFVPIELGQHRLDAASEAFDQVSEDYPGFAQSDEETSAEAMNHFVMQTLGPIDPRGPNGWILRAQEGKPEPGDENQYIHWPGATPTETELADADDADAEEPAEDEVSAPESDEEPEPVPDDEPTEEPK